MCKDECCQKNGQCVEKKNVRIFDNSGLFDNWFFLISRVDSVIPLSICPYPRHRGKCEKCCTCTVH